MKKIFAVASAIVISLGISLKAQAVEEVTSFKDMAGIKPDSILYPVDKAFDSLKITLTFSDESKAKVLVEVAQERLGESEAMSDEGKASLAEQAASDYNDDINKASDELASAIEKDDSTGSETDEQNIQQTGDKIVLTQEKSIDILTALLSKQEGTAKDTIQKVIAMQQEKKEAVAAMVKERHELNSARKELNTAKVAVKKAQKSNDNDALEKAQAALKEKQDAYDKQLSEYNTAVQNKKEVEKGIGKSKKQTGEEVNQNTGSTTGSTADSTTVNQDNSGENGGTAVNQQEVSPTPAPTVQTNPLQKNEKDHSKKNK